MGVVDLTYSDFREIFDASRGSLVHYWTKAPDLRRALFARLKRAALARQG